MQLKHIPPPELYEYVDSIPFRTLTRARLCINGRVSRPFSHHRGARQGCLLSPLLFSIAIEPHAQILSHSPDMQGMWIGTLEERVSLYVDDMLLYLSTIMKVLKIIQDFGTFSGFKVNWSKSSVCPVDLGSPISLPLECPLQLTTSFRIQVQHVCDK